jgi:hypothetical protein
MKGQTPPKLRWQSNCTPRIQLLAAARVTITNNQKQLPSEQEHQLP